MRKPLALALVIVFCSSQLVFAAGKRATLIGTVDGGTGSSYIEVGDRQYTFGTESPIANKIFKACKQGDKCIVEVILDKEGEIDKVVSANKASAKKLLASQTSSEIFIIKASSQTPYDKDVVSRKATEITGTIEQGHDEAGGNFWVNGGKKKQYTLRYVFDLDDATQELLGKLADSKTKVTVKGILKKWKDGSSSFDEAQPITIFK